ncbi:hypothetical protein Pmani_028731 [Petrolisthes manimaculis]|uniref:Serine/threonine-protein kinase ULK3 n=1 Tax=Petrolisthes manimaculis TaxID=1843537 RepID=A0AAE1P052_9EUCA|nr:hypothetical protein Pmani_028731 [Petrolisthes manimaculis]
MEYCSGGDLSTLVRSRRRLSESVCRRFLQQLASALQYMRQRNVSHLDLKPSNILLKSRTHPVLKIGDFGLAQHMLADDTTTTIKGSPLYMAPEIILKHQYDAKVDIWSVGVILYECLFGKAPYSSKTLDQLIEKIKTDKPIEVPYGTNVSSACRDLLQTCLERDVCKRIDFEAFFKHPFVDVEHAPGPQSLTKAQQLLTLAVNFDHNRDYEHAFTHYCEALQFLVPVLHVERNAGKRTALRRKITEYMNRTEELQKTVNSENVRNTRIPDFERRDSATGSTSNEYRGNRDELLRLTGTTPQIRAAIEIAASGELYTREGNTVAAFEKYQLALGKLLALMQKEPNGRRKELLREEITKWMTQAELLKDIINSSSSSGSSGGKGSSSSSGGSSDVNKVVQGQEVTETFTTTGDVDKNCNLM